MKISIGCDHAGFEAKEMIISLLKELKHDVLDLGTNSIDSVDYPIYGLKVGESIKNKIVKLSMNNSAGNNVILVRKSIR